VPEHTEVAQVNACELLAPGGPRLAKSFRMTLSHLHCDMTSKIMARNILSQIAWSGGERHMLFIKDLQTDERGAFECENEYCMEI